MRPVYVLIQQTVHVEQLSIYELVENLGKSNVFLQLSSYVLIVSYACPNIKNHTKVEQGRTTDNNIFITAN